MEPLLVGMTLEPLLSRLGMRRLRGAPRSPLSEQSWAPACTTPGHKSQGMRGWGLGQGLRIQGSGFRVQVVGCRVQGTGFMVQRFVLKVFRGTKTTTLRRQRAPIPGRRDAGARCSPIAVLTEKLGTSLHPTQRTSNLFMNNPDWIIRRSYGGNYRRYIGGFLRIT